MSLYVTAFGFGLVTAAILTIPTVGFSLQFAITGVLNLAYGSVMTLSAYAAYMANRDGVGIWWCLGLATVAGSVGSYLLNLVIFKRFQRRRTSAVSMIVVSLAVGIVLSNGLLAIAGASPVSYRTDPGQLITFGDLQFTFNQLVIVGLGIGVMLVVHVLLRFTRLGKAMRASAANPTLATHSGIRVDLIVSRTWLLSGALCGLGGAAFALDSSSFTPTSSGTFVIVVLAAAILGGVGNAYGAMIGAIIIGLAVEVSAVPLTPSYKYVVAFVILLACMLARPEGIAIRGRKVGRPA